MKNFVNYIKRGAGRSPYPITYIIGALAGIVLLPVFYVSMRTARFTLTKADIAILIFSTAMLYISFSI